jgi:ADP-ribose pyrophosphatase YjhB (NUDIX family)
VRWVSSSAAARAGWSWSWASAGASDRSVTWTLPKGTPTADESVEQTALREVAEETGLEVRIIAPVGPIEYFFTSAARASTRPSTTS